MAKKDQELSPEEQAHANATKAYQQILDKAAENPHAMLDNIYKTCCAQMKEAGLDPKDLKKPKQAKQDKQPEHLEDSTAAGNGGEPRQS